jgi:hypothetical protein
MIIKHKFRSIKSGRLIVIAKTDYYILVYATNRKGVQLKPTINEMLEAYRELEQLELNKYKSIDPVQ